MFEILHFKTLMYRTATEADVHEWAAMVTDKVKSELANWPSHVLLDPADGTRLCFCTSRTDVSAKAMAFGAKVVLGPV